MNLPLLQIKNLRVNFTGNGVSTTAVNNINIEVNRGEVVAIVGESGSGKSVTALSILQLLPSPPAQYVNGEIWFNNHQQQRVNLLSLSPVQLQQIRGNQVAMIFQEPMTSLNPVHTCGAQVMEAIILHQNLTAIAAKAQTLALFEKVNLPFPEQLFKRYPHQLSGGQKQRVMIAMAMSCNPSLLICDEPTTALDVTVQKTILQLIKALQQTQDMGVIFITHDLGVVAEIADRIVVMYKGSIVEQATAKAIYTNPQHPYTKALLACRPMHHQHGKRLPVVSDFMQLNSKGHLEAVVEPNPALLTAHLSLGISKSDTIQLKQPEDILLSVENLKVWFPVKKPLFQQSQDYIKAVDDVSFKVFRGETLGLVGESGCGKTTLGRALIRLIEPLGGAVYFNGQNIAAANKKELQQLRRQMQIVFQDPYASLNPRMSIGTAIEEPLKFHHPELSAKQRKESVLTLLSKVNLEPGHYHRYPHEFSGGQRQRIVIARALILNPSFLICDESVSALDVSVQAQVLNLLNDLKKEFGFTAIFISHDLSVVRYISNRIMVMNKGKIVETGPADDLYNNPQSPYTRQLINAIPRGMPA